MVSKNHNCEFLIIFQSLQNTEVSDYLYKYSHTSGVLIEVFQPEGLWELTKIILLHPSNIVKLMWSWFERYRKRSLPKLSNLSKNSYIASLLLYFSCLGMWTEAHPTPMLFPTPPSASDVEHKRSLGLPMFAQSLDGSSPGSQVTHTC